MATNYAKIQNNEAHSDIEDEVNTTIKQITDTTHDIPLDKLTTLLTNLTTEHTCKIDRKNNT